MTSLRVDVKPDVLTWARESAGFSPEDAAKKIGVYPLDLQYWEAGVGSPTIAQLRSIAAAYKRPLTVFFLDEPPEEDDGLPDFRLLPESHGESWSPELREAFRRVQRQRRTMIELTAMSGDVPPPIDLQISTGEDIETSSSVVRDWLFETGPSGEAFAHRVGLKLSEWIALVERKAILVVQIQNVLLREMRGFSIAERPFPIVSLNSKDSQNGKKFTLLHELTHILLHTDSLCDLADVGTLAMGEVLNVERFCNSVAVAALMPRALLLADDRVASASSNTRWTDANLKELATTFAVSEEALLLRLVEVGKASSEFYWEKRRHFLARYVEAKERAEDREGAKGGWGNYYQLKLRSYGKRYVSSVLDSYHRRDINTLEVSDYLDIRVDNIPKLEALLEA